MSGRRQTDQTDSLLRMNEELALTGIVAESLPPTLGTADEPEVIEVPADPQLTQRLTTNGRTTVKERFDGDRLANDLADLFRETL